MLQPLIFLLFRQIIEFSLLHYAPNIISYGVLSTLLQVSQSPVTLLINELNWVAQLETEGLIPSIIQLVQHIKRPVVVFLLFFWLVDMDLTAVFVESSSIEIDEFVLMVADIALLLRQWIEETEEGALNPKQSEDVSELCINCQLLLCHSTILSHLN